MAADEKAEGSGLMLEGISEFTRDWWTSVLAGGADMPHPIYGPDLQAKVHGDTLLVSGSVPSEENRQAVAAEAEHLKGHGFSDVRIALEVVPEKTDESGVLSQTLIGVFENSDLAMFAEQYIENHLQVRPQLVRVIDPITTGKGRAVLEALLPEAFWQDATKKLDEGQALLVLTIDETAAFKARELLDEETRSTETMILPPEASGNTDSARRALENVEERS